MITSLELLSAGTCYAPRRVVLPGSGRGRVALPATFALLRHERLGYLLFDTGFGDVVAEHRCTPWGRVYAASSPYSISPEQTAAAQLHARGIAAAEVTAIVISHFHVDHVGGLTDFPTARFYAAAEAYDDVRDRRGLGSLRRAFLPATIPADFEARAELFATDRPLAEHPVVGPAHDLLGDGSLWATPLPGHARGQIGLYCELPGRRILLAADGAYLGANVTEGRPSSEVTRLFIDSWRAYRRTLARLTGLARAGVEVVPSHCPAALSLTRAYRRG